MHDEIEQLARQFEEAHSAFIAPLERLSDAEWRRTSPGEGWPLGVTVRHIAQGHALSASVIAAFGTGLPLPAFDPAAIHAQNAIDAAQHATITGTEVLELLSDNAAVVVDAIRALDGAALERTGIFVAQMGPITTRQFIEGPAMGHFQGHAESVRAALAAVPV